MLAMRTETDALPSVNRRTLLRGVGSGGLVALAGCTGTDSDGSPTDTGGGSGGETGTRSPVANLTPGGHARVSYITGVDNLNPLKGTYASLIVGDWMYSKLTDFNHKLKLKPDLATDWSVNSAGDTWTFNLRKDATFSHNGSQVLASDVKASVEAWISNDRFPGATQAAGPVDSVTAVDETTVEITYKHPYIDAPLKLAKDKSKIVPKEVLENRPDELATKDFGSGPFVLEKFEHNNFYRFSAYDDYFKTDDEGRQLPYLDKLTMKVFQDSVAKVKALKDRRLDAIQRLSVTNAQQIKNSDDNHIVRQKYGQWLPIVLTNTIKPMDDVRVRQAMKYAVNKKPMVEAASGYAIKSQDHPITPVNKYYTELEPKFGPGAKIEKAKSLLEDAGHGDGFELPPLWYSKQGNPLREPIALLFKQQMKKIGIEFDLKVVTSSRWLSEAWNKPDYWYISNWGIYLLESGIFTLACTSDAPWNEMKFSNKKFDKVVANAIRAQDEEKKAKLMQDAQRILRNKGGWIIPFNKNRLGGAANYVNNFHVDPTATQSFMSEVSLTADAPNPPK